MIDSTLLALDGRTDFAELIFDGKVQKLCSISASKVTQAFNKKMLQILTAFKYTPEELVSKIICPIHGEFEQFPHNHLKGAECLECSFIKRKTNDDKFLKKAKIKHNNKYDYSKIEYNGFNGKVKIICHIHGEFQQTPHSHLKGQGCPICKESKGEIKIRELLNTKNINFISQHKFKECRYRYPLPFDFYLPEYNTCIEFNGIQHYKPIPHWGGVERFLEQQIKDKIKYDFCINNKINLIVIKYNENISKIITKLKKIQNG